LCQVEYEQELELLRSAHRRELVRSKEEMMQLLAAAEEKSLRVDEDSIRKKYIKEIERIKVRMLYHDTGACMHVCVTE